VKTKSKKRMLQVKTNVRAGAVLKPASVSAMDDWEAPNV
jgi:hypothetical protein